MKNKNLRLTYTTLFIILFVTEVLIALFVHDKFVRPYVGDVLVVMVIYCFARIFAPTGCKFLPLYVFIFAAVVETLQLFNFVKLLHLENCRVLAIALGSTFDFSDIVCYFVGCVTICLVSFFKNKIVTNHFLKSSNK